MTGRRGLAAVGGVAALQLLSDSDAVIIDLRGNGGGSPAMVGYLTSAFTPKGADIYNTFHSRDGTFSEAPRDWYPSPRLDVKLRVFRDLDRAAPAGAILASNTSGFPIAAMAGATTRPERVIGWHWASPAFVMRFAEIVVTNDTAAAVQAAVCEVASRCGKNPIVVKDQPMAWGFVANRVYGAMLREAARVVEEGVATHEQVNQLMVDCFRWPVGPFAMEKGASSGWRERKKD